MVSDKNICFLYISLGRTVDPLGRIIFDLYAAAIEQTCQRSRRGCYIPIIKAVLVVSDEIFLNVFPIFACVNHMTLMAGHFKVLCLNLYKLHVFMQIRCNFTDFHTSMKRRKITFNS